MLTILQPLGFDLNSRIRGSNPSIIQTCVWLIAQTFSWSNPLWISKYAHLLQSLCQVCSFSFYVTDTLSNFFFKWWTQTKITCKLKHRSSHVKWVFAQIGPMVRFKNNLQRPGHCLSSINHFQNDWFSLKWDIGIQLKKIMQEERK